jgi:hypothetical protein
MEYYNLSFVMASIGNLNEAFKGLFSFSIMTEVGYFFETSRSNAVAEDGIIIRYG